MVFCNHDPSPAAALAACGFMGFLGAKAPTFGINVKTCALKLSLTICGVSIVVQPICVLVHSPYVSTLIFHSDTGDTSGHQADGVHGHLGPNIMYSKRWIANSLMHVKHVPKKRQRWGGNFGATIHMCKPATALKEPNCWD